MTRNKILFVHHDGLVTGSAISLRNLLLGLDRLRFEPRVLLGDEGPARLLYEELGVSVKVVPIHGFKTFPGPSWPSVGYMYNWLALLPNIPLTNYLRKQTPDLVHLNDKALLSAGLAAHKLGIATVWHLRSTYKVSSSQLHAKLSAFIIRKIANGLIAISEDEVDCFEDEPNLQVIYNSVDFKKVENASKQRNSIHSEFDIKNDEILIGTVSTTLSENRGSWDFIRAVGILKARFPEMKFRFMIVAGIQDQSIEDQAWDLARDVGISDSLILTGFRTDVLVIMAAMNIVVVCTRRGVLGRMPFEAMAIGRPLVVTAGHSGQSKVVINGETALVVPPAQPDLLANGIEELVRSPDLCLKIGNQGRVYARQNFDPKQNALAIMQIYDKVLANQEKTSN